MLMNLANMRAVHDQFMAFTTNASNMQIDMHGGRFTYKGGFLDQGALNTFFENKTDFLPWEYNWKPLWEYNENHRLLHFSGMKPTGYKGILKKGNNNRNNSVYYRKCKENHGCEKHMAIFNEWLSKVSD